MNTEQKDSLLVAEKKTDESKTFNITCYADNGDIYMIELKDNMPGAVKFNRILAQIKKNNPKCKIDFYNYTSKPFNTPGIEAYFKFNCIDLKQAEKDCLF